VYCAIISDGLCRDPNTFDFANNLLGVNDLAKLDSKATTTTIEKKLGGSNIGVVWRHMSDWNAQSIEMDPHLNAWLMLRTSVDGIDRGLVCSLRK